MLPRFAQLTSQKQLQERAGESLRRRICNCEQRLLPSDILDGRVGYQGTALLDLNAASFEPEASYSKHGCAINHSKPAPLREYLWGCLKIGELPKFVAFAWPPCAQNKIRPIVQTP